MAWSASTSDSRSGDNTPGRTIDRNTPHSSSTSASTPSPVRRDRLRRIPAPAILPPILDSTPTSSTLHLTLDKSSGSLSKQVDSLLSRHLHKDRITSSPVTIPETPSVPPPRLPPKPASPPSQKTPPTMARRPLPVPPMADDPQYSAYGQYRQQPGPPPSLPYQYPASYGPSISKIRSFSAQPPASNGLTPSLMPQGMPGRAGQAPGNVYQQPRLPANGTVSRSFAKGGSSIMLHKGFFDLLNLASYPESQQEPQLGPPQPSYAERGWTGDRQTSTIGKRAVTAPAMGSSYGLPPIPKPPRITPNGRGNRRISVDMIGRPTGFTHLAHASDAEQAEEILHRWRIDGKGKLAEPAWVVAIKEAARARARAQGIAQVQAHMDAEQQKGSLKVVNANPDSLISVSSDHAEHGSHTGHSPIEGMPPTRSPLSSPPIPMSVSSPPMSPLSSLPLPGFPDDKIIVHEEIPNVPILPPPNLRTNTAQTMIIRSSDALKAVREGDEAGFNTPSKAAREAHEAYGVQSSSPPPIPSAPSARQLAEEAAATLPNGKPFKPSLETVERSVATKIYLENHYYGILKRPRDRDQRKAALERELSVANMSDSQRRAIRTAWMSSETEYLRDIRNRVSANSFIKVKTIGHGAFGVVSLVKERGSGELYAMKQLRKADMLRKGQEGHVRAERDVMSAASSSANSRWIVRLVYSFQDVDHLYMVMEFMGGGDLLNLLIEKDVFEEGFAKFYIAEMVLAIQEAHKLGYIHRDIKPDNFIFSSDGHIKLSDFGLATDFHWAHDGAYYEEQRRNLLRKHGIDLEESNPLAGGKRFNSSYAGLDLNDLPQGGGGAGDEVNKGVLTWRDKNRKKLAYSVVGTNSYMSPEVIRGTGYDQSCDWWSLGIILFECLYGYPPFVSKSRHVTRQKILTWRQSLRFPSRPKVSREAQDLIERLICEKEDRLGSRTQPSTIRTASLLAGQRRSGFLGPVPGFLGLKDGAEDIKAHPWFRGIDFGTLHLQDPPFKPELKDATDTRYFDDDIADEPLPAPDAQPGQADATKDPMLRDKVYGKHLLDVRKQLAFQGYTFKSPKQKVFDPRQGLQSIVENFEAVEDTRGRSILREPSSGFRRAMSL